MSEIHARAGPYDVNMGADDGYRGTVRLSWRRIDGSRSRPWVAHLPIAHLQLSHSDGMPYLCGGDEPTLLDDNGEPIPACVLIVAALTLQGQRIRDELIQAMGML